MIRINLLPVQQDRKRQYGKQQLALGLLLIVAEVAALYTVYSAREEQVQGARRQANELQAQVTALEEENAEIARLNASKAQLEGMGRVLGELEANRAGPVQVLDELKMMLNAPGNDLQRVNQQYNGWDTNWDPTNLWIESFDETNGVVMIRGKAMANDDIAEFNIRLASSAYFTNVRLNRTQAASEAGLGRIFTFELSARVNYAVAANQGS
jgi:Tfp pilus assembly protein PilN